MRRVMRGAASLVLAATVAVPLGSTPPVGAAVPDPTFASGGVVTNVLLDRFGPVAVDGSGRIVVLGVASGSVAVARFLPSGAPDTSFSGDGLAPLGIATSRELVDVRVLLDGSVMAAGRRTEPADISASRLWTAKLDPSGALVAGYGSGGLVDHDPGDSASNPRGAFAADGSIAVVWTRSFGPGAVTTFTANGAPTDRALLVDTSVFGAGCVASGDPRVVAAANVTSTEFVHLATVDLAGATCPLSSGKALTRQQVGGGVVWSWAVPSTETLSFPDARTAFELVGADVLFASNTAGTVGVRRHRVSDGQPVSSWGTGGRATVDPSLFLVGDVAGLGDGKVAVVNAAISPAPFVVVIDRLLPTGATDGDFGRVEVPAFPAGLAAAALSGAGGGGAVVVSAQIGLEGTLRKLVGDVEPEPEPEPEPDPEPVEEPDAVPVEPARLLDTRVGGVTVDGVAQGLGRAGAGSVTRVRVAGRGGVPVDASAAIVNFTVVSPDAGGFATVYPCSPVPPVASSINYSAGSFVANGVTAKLDASGDVCVFTLSASDLLIDVNGFVPVSSGIGTVEPARLLDTRVGGVTVDGVAQGLGRAGAGSVTRVRVAGRGGVPVDASAAIVNFTVVSPDAGGFATVYPCSPVPPVASSINYSAGSFVANGVTAKLDASGDVCVFTLSASDLLIDVNGFVPVSSGIGTVEPARLLDTRVGGVTVDGVAQGLGRAGAGSVTRVRVAGRGGVPVDASAAIVNFTVVSPDAGGFATVYPCSPVPPVASSINYSAGSFVANGVTAKLDASGDVCVFTLSASDLLIDVNGFVLPADDE
jgi:hypothetical protein